MSEYSRRRFLQITGAAGLAAWTPLRLAPGADAFTLASGRLDPRSIHKYAAPLPVPPAMPGTARGGVDHYQIVVRQFRQQVLPVGLPATTVWGYGPAHHPALFHTPAATIEARHGRPVRVTWVNGLVDRRGNHRPHLLPVDPTLHWANPPGGRSGRDAEPTLRRTPGPYRGPVPVIPHLHGGHTFDHSDGYPEAWFLPRAHDIPDGYARHGSFYAAFRRSSPLGDRWGPGRAVFEYPNDQRAATLWYHDHTLGMTRVNVYAGMAGFYLLRGGPHDLPDGVLPGPSSNGGGDGRRPYEIPLAIQDRSFNRDGSLFYPRSRRFFDDFAGPYVPVSEVPPIWNPEFFGDTMTVNGRTWPVSPVEPRRYRFRILNGCNSRFLILKIAADPTRRPAKAALPLWMVGTEGGYLRRPVELDQLLLGPAERADLVVDFTGLRPGTELHLVNLGPDEPFGELTEPPEPFADPRTTGQVMKFRVVPLRSHDTSTPPDRLDLPRLEHLGRATRVRRLSLNEKASSLAGFDGPIEAQLGTLGRGGARRPLDWDDPVTEHPHAGSTEVWELHNFTQDAHPIHVHLVQFRVLGRRPLDGGVTVPPTPEERGFKDTVIAYPGQVTRIKARFDRPGRYVWHCHILEHEDNEMMRPYLVGHAR